MNTIHTDIGDFVLDCVDDSPDPRDFVFVAPTFDEIPSSVDHRADVPGIMNQNPEGACVGHAVCAAAEFLYSKRLNRKIDLSQRFIYRKTRENDPWPGENYHGTSTRDGVKAWAKFGICEEMYWPWIPYRVKFGTSGFDLVTHENSNYNSESLKNAREYPAFSYHKCLTPRDIKYAIYKNGIVVVRAELHSGWLIWDGPEHIIWNENSIQDGGHAFALVGYDENERHYTVVNSWGERWGNKGFAYLSYDDFEFNGGAAWAIIIGP